MKPELPFVDLTPGSDRQAIDAAIARVLNRGQFVLGPEVEAFEGEFAQRAGVPHAVAVNSGTDALALLLRALGIQPGDEVVVPAVSSPFTGLAVLQAGGRPVFVDIDPDRATLDPAALADTLTPRTKAVVVVHLYGQPADLESIEAVTRNRDIALVEDCAHAHLATCKGIPVGLATAGGAFSFYPTKNLGALGDAGAVVTSDERLAGRVRQLRHGGQSAPHLHAEAGVNSRMDELQAAVLRVRLTALHLATERRRQLAHFYRAALASADVRVPEPQDPGHVYHLFTVHSDRRDELRRHMDREGVGTLIHYPCPLPLQPAFEQFRRRRCPAAERHCSSVLSLPLHPRLQDEDVMRVVDCVRAF